MALTEAQRSTLRRLSGVWRDLDFVLVGASAIKVWRPDYLRETNDLDVSVAIDLDAHPAGLDEAPGWRPDPRLPHRWYSPEGIAVDVLPAGPKILEAGRIDWADGCSMNMTGFGHALSRAELRDVGGIQVAVAPLDVLALLKAIAYLDRPVERGRDLEDLAYLLGNYVDGDDPRRWEETPESLDFHHGPAFLLGRDMSRWLTDHERTALQDFLNRARDEADAHATGGRMARRLPLEFRLGDRTDVQAVLLGLLESFAMGMISDVE